MFSLDNFYYVLYKNLLQPANFSYKCFIPFGSIDAKDFKYFSDDDPYRDYPFKPPGSHYEILFYEQEPLFIKNVSLLVDADASLSQKFDLFSHDLKLNVLANSEHSEEKNKICKEFNFYNWYFFFHGFAALSWYGDYKYLAQVENKISKVFINLNRLTTKDRSYRLYLVSKMMEKGIVDKGIVSLYLTDPSQPNWRDELIDPNSNLSKPAKLTIYKNLKNLTDSLVVDNQHPQGNLSAFAGQNELKLNQSALWHVVSETVFYYKKLHLTEKIFKPIVSQRPFILVAAPGNLAYLKSYGFKTFDRWIDESYDNEPDNDKRINMITEELEKLCSLTSGELENMHKEMQETLKYNFNHFYTNFKEIVVDEMLLNFQNVINQWNNGLPTNKKIDLSNINFDTVKEVLLS
jgi:hypothetical protein